MSRIREKATESEAVVRNITKDIQSLDLGKKNLILSMTTLKRLQMLGMWILILHRLCSHVSCISERVEPTGRPPQSQKIQ
jgi:hypothetical protein